jgi:peptidoglycan/xylan/chitin deacetylase (PgdA/CDA1 family)
MKKNISVKTCGLCFAGLAVVIIAVFSILVFTHKPILPILLYHSVSSEVEDDNIPSITRQLFSRQMEFLSKNGYETVFMKTVIENRKQAKPIPANWIILTFDDGYRDFYTNVYPVLRKFNLKATLFVAPVRIGKTQEYLTWEELRLISEGGSVEIGSHSLLHNALTCLNTGQARQRIMLSKKLLEENLHKPVTVFAYPYGALSYDIREMVKDSGYEAATGTVYPMGEFRTGDIYNLRRVFVSKISKYPGVFRFMLSGYYVPIRGLVLRLLNVKTPRDAAECVYVM